MRFRPRTDANQKEIVAALRKAGANVMILAGQGGGVPDLLVQFRDVLYLLEVKDGSKKPSAQALTPDQKRSKAIWRFSVVTNIPEAYQAIGILFGGN
jgi:hypothetical protein